MWRNWKMMQSLWRTVWWFFKKLNVITVIWPSNSTPMYIPKKVEDRYSNKYLYTNVYSSIIQYGPNG